MRIAIFHNLHSGGAKRVVVQEARLLSQRHDITVITMEHADRNFGEDERSERVAGLTFRENYLPMLHSPLGRLNPMIRLINLQRLENAEKKAAARIDDLKYDVVLIHPCQVTQTPVLLKYIRTPNVYYSQELPRRLYEPVIQRPYHKRSSYRRILDRIDPLPRLYDRRLKSVDRNAVLKSNAILTNSNFTRQNLYKAYGLEAQVCYPGVESRVREFSRRPREKFVLSVGALTPAKGFDFVIRALGSQPDSTRLPLVIVSNYQESLELAYLKDLAFSENVQVDFQKGISEKALQDLYQRAGCVACAAINEPLGLTPLEAMATGAPVIGVNEGGILETILDGQTGLLAPRDPYLFGQRVLELINNQDLAQKLGNAGLVAIQEKWTWDRHIAELETALSKAADKVKGITS